MFNENTMKQKAFTIIELLVVVAIIAVLATIIVAGVSQYLKKARNTKRLTDIENYAKAFEMARGETGEYPDTGVLDTLYCLGDYKNDKCGSGDYTIESAAFNAIIGQYIALPADEYKIYVSPPNPAAYYRGYTYKCVNRDNDICSSIQVYYYLEGFNTSCGVGEVGLADDAKTVCHYYRSF